MDDVNVLSLADVLRAIRRERQVILTTHDMLLAQMLGRKLRPLEPGQRTLLVKLSRWTRIGPQVDVEAMSHGPSTKTIEFVGAHPAL